MNETDNCVLNDAFKSKFKYYKSNKKKPSLEEVVKIEENVKVSQILRNDIIENSRTDLLGLQKLSSWKLFSLPNHPGLFLIQNPFTSLGQRFWVRKCLEIYPRNPNKMNIDIEMCCQDWWKDCHVNGHLDRQFQKKLRWTTLGYHHDWDTKLYTEESKTPFPEELAELSDIVAKYLGFENYRAQAAIVNYYHMDSTLSAHTDHSEINLEAPLFSFSFGQSAIFLIGGQDKSIEPTAVLINSGDIMIMSKEARLCYHAVPKILESSAKPWNNVEELIPISNEAKFKYISSTHEIISCMNKNINYTEWSKFADYIEKSRINMNVRQVLKENQESLNDSELNDS